MSGGAAAARSGGWSAPSVSPPSHPPSSASRSLPRPPCAASGDCCPELPRSLRYPAPARVGRKEARRRPCPPPPNVRWGRELICARTGSRVGRDWGPGCREEGARGQGVRLGRPRSFGIELPSPACTGSGGPEFLADVGVRGLVWRRGREPRNQP